jgi:Zn-dependent M28 family amino/carboxypeptidase
VPGADDNCAATSSLLIAAEMLKNLQLDTDVWLLHLTGEVWSVI